MCVAIQHILRSGWWLRRRVKSSTKANWHLLSCAAAVIDGNRGGDDARGDESNC